jgi:hypothetical protein
MALIKEDGSIVSSANSYVTRAELIAYAIARGVTLADTDATDVLAIKAMDYLTMYDSKWAGDLVEPGVQTLAWPRTGAIPQGGKTAFPDDEIPGNIVKAQMELALVANSGVDLLPTTNPATGFVTREKVDVIETEYSEAVALQTFGQLPKVPLVDALLAPWMAGGGMSLRTYRV